ncbi:MAG: hypothetical protein LBT04_01675 [Prevotellaceae bacterium]|jgi:GT2 family glycosyltransferase|nr:hypothetical protein [Prevotellaceae bacterium]
MNEIQIILVLYRTELQDSLSYLTLCEHIHRLSVPYELLIYNNSTEIKIKESTEYIVVNAEKNNMLAQAYNYALERAVKNNRKWLLLLDQDTFLSEEYFERLNVALNLQVKVAAILPVLKCKDKHLSPRSYSSIFGPWGKTNNIEESGIISNKMVSAFNSVAFLSINSLQETGGFSEEFPLDALDTHLFYKLSRNGGYFYLLDVVLQHNLSVLDYSKYMTKERYDSIVNAEYILSKQMGIIPLMTLKVRLFFRLCKQILVRKKRPYVIATLKILVFGNSY